MVMLQTMHRYADSIILFTSRKNYTLMIFVPIWLITNYHVHGFVPCPVRVRQNYCEPVVF